MKKILLLLSLTVLCTTQTLANDSCFIVKENNKIIKSGGSCTKQYAPCSSFKIALSLIGYDAGILKNETEPKWIYKPEYEAFMESWKEPQTPKSWLKNSCVWYSQVLTKKLGMEQFQNYVNKFDYGNMDLSGDKDQNNGLTHAWLSSSLEISPNEQMLFLEKFLNDKLLVSEHAMNMTKNIMYVEDLKLGWKLYGKTGSGYLLNINKEKSEIKHGWFIGWLEKGERKIIFVNHIVDDKKNESHAGPRAKEQAKEKLLQLISKIEQ